MTALIPSTVCLKHRTEPVSWRAYRKQSVSLGLCVLQMTAWTGGKDMAGKLFVLHQWQSQREEGGKRDNERRRARTGDGKKKLPQQSPSPRGNGTRSLGTSETTAFLPVFWKTRVMGSRLSSQLWPSTSTISRVLCLSASISSSLLLLQQNSDESCELRITVVDSIWFHLLCHIDCQNLCLLR